MAFSYSDKNFTVIGNLCFVHILVKGTEVTYAIPPAIRDRMLIDDFFMFYVAYNNKTESIAKAYINNGNIYCFANEDTGYLNFCFPIDSNK